MSLSELLAETITDYKNHVSVNRLRLYYCLMSFRQYRIDNHIGNTISSTLSKIKTFYKYNRVAVPFIPPINTKNIRRYPSVSYGDLLTKSEIKKALGIVDDNLAMWIYVMMSSGSSRLEAKMLTNKTFYEGTYEYHQKDNFKDALRFICGSDNVVCTCKLTRQKTDIPYYTFHEP